MGLYPPPGILLSITLLTALGVAILETPHVQQWLEDQRKRLAELLRSLGEELDPESRRQAEAFAFEGRSPDAGVRGEVSGSREAVGVATGRSGVSEGMGLGLGLGALSRRIPVTATTTTTTTGKASEQEAEERRRQGREYLAQRNREMIELRAKKRAAVKCDGEEGTVTPMSATSFDAMVDAEGMLRGEDDEGRIALVDQEMPVSRSAEPATIPEKTAEPMREVERPLFEPVLATASSSNAFAAGSVFANPFSDEYALDNSEADRSATPRPPTIPPKIALAATTPEDANDDTRSMPGSFAPSLTPLSPRPASSVMTDAPRLVAPEHEAEELTYEEQLAIALSLSEAESAQRNAAVVRQSPSSSSEEDDQVKAAIAASLRAMDGAQAAHALEHAGAVTPRVAAPDAQRPLLVDLSAAGPPGEEERREWRSLFDPRCSPSQEPRSLDHAAPSREAAAIAAAAAAAPPPSDVSDELYRLTPELTRARLASHDAAQPGAQPQQTIFLASDARSRTLSPQPPAAGTQGMEASFYSAPSSVAPASTAAASEGQLIDAPDAEMESESEDFASLSPSRADSQTWSSEVSDVEVIDVDTDADSDADMMSEAGRVGTPDSWTEVGSRDGDSEVDDEARERMALA